MPLLLNSCFLIKLPIDPIDNPIKDSVHVYHFIISKKNVADSITTEIFTRESKKAYDWITREASLNHMRLNFKETWVENKDPELKSTFIHKLPSFKLKTLLLNSEFRMITKKRTRTQKEKIEKISWRKRLFESMAGQVKDSAMAKILIEASKNKNSSNNQLIMIHLLKARKSWITGFYDGGRAFIGVNKSKTIAHESLHHLGAVDLYIHKFWFGKRRRIVVKDMRQEIMNDVLEKNFDSNTYFVSSYTAYMMDGGITWSQILSLF